MSILNMICFADFTPISKGVKSFYILKYGNRPW